MATILIADDNVTNRYFLEKVLSEAGYDAHSVKDGQELVAQFKTIKPDLVITDVKMPVLDGYAAVEQLRTFEDAQHVPIIFISATFRDMVHKVRGFDLGANDYLTTPVDEDELKAKVKSMLKTKELYEQVHHTKEVLREKEKWLQTMLRSIGDALIATDGQGKVTLMNQVAEKLTGWREKEALGKQVADVFHILNEETGSEISDLVGHILLKGNLKNLGNNTVLIRKDGTRIPIDNNGAPIQDAMGNILGVIFIFHDISSRKEMEEKIREGKREWEATFDAMSDWVTLIDLKEYRIRRSNRAGETFCGAELKDIIGRTCCELLHGSLRPRSECPIKRMLKTRQKETEAFFKPDTGQWLTISVDPVLDEKKNIIAVVHVVHDNTESKRAEMVVRESEEMARAFLNAISDVAAVIDTRGTLLDANEAMARRFGMSIQEFIGQSGWDLLPPKLRARRKTFADQVIQSGEPVTFEDEREGVHFHNVFYPVRDFRGRVTKIALLARDITERIKSEEALRESEERFSKVFHASPMLMAVTRMNDSHIIDINESFLQIFGYRRDEIVGKKTIDLGLWADPQERSAYMRLLEEQQRVRNFEVQICTRRGEIRSLLLSGEIIHLGDERYLITVANDITERKRAEEEKEQLLMELKDAVRNIKTLHGLLPICSSCKKIRDDKGYWREVELYVRDHSEADFSHSFCPDCLEKLYPDLNNFTK